GLYAVSPGICTKCPTGATTASTGSFSVQACFCTTGTYGAAFSNEECKMCGNTVGISCPANSSLPVIAAGYARDPENIALAYVCSPSAACPSSTESLQTECGVGYTGSICGSCDQQYYRTSSLCSKCPLVSGMLVGSVVCIIALIIVGVFMYRKNTP